ncbi:MAG TPA: TIGR03118 family protein [Candidatus Sulfotelmatobacter sp.]|nr:TIGR03118 family protein [Candidatus Sulfotelmatobacter sp.]
MWRSRPCRLPDFVFSPVQRISFSGQPPPWQPGYDFYAKQDAFRHDPAGGAGLGFVELFTPSGRHIGHLEHGDWFNAPWGVVWTTRDFGEFSNAILVGNFRSGWIAAFNGFTHKFIGFVRNPDDSIMTIDGIWSLTFANDGTAGLANTLYFTAGINNEADGLFGTITPVDGLDGDEE